MDIEQGLKGKSREELERIARVLSEQAKAYKSGKLFYYDPHSGGPDGGQLAFHKSQAKIRAIISGNRFGKSTCSVIECIWLATGTHPYNPIPIPNKGKIYADSYPMVMDNIKLKFDEWCPPEYLDRDKPYVYNQQGLLIGANFACGSHLKIGSYDQQTRKSEGSDWDYVAMDEPPPRELYVANLRGLVDRNGRMWITCTPLSEAWLYDDIYMPGISGEKGYIKIFRGSSHDNPTISPEGLHLFLSELTENERKVREFGEFLTLRGLVIDTYNPVLSNMRGFDVGEEFNIYEGIDVHARKANVALYKAVHRSGVRFAIDEVIFDGGVYDFGKVLAQKRRELCQYGAVFTASVSDTSINQKDMAFKMNQYNELKRSLREEGETVMPSLANKKGWLMPGIQKIKDLYRAVDHSSKVGLEIDGEYKSDTLVRQGSQIAEFLSEIFGNIPMPTQYVFDKCVEYKKELLHYKWPDNLEDLKNDAVPEKKFDELIDCDRYIESLAPAYYTPGMILYHTFQAPKNKVQIYRQMDKRFGGFDNLRDYVRSL